MRVPAERYVEYYRDILTRIAAGYSTPASLAQITLDWVLHHPDCGIFKGDFGECDKNCSSNDGEVKP
jgi:hypothetical protein